MVAIISGHFTVSLTVKYPFFLTTSLSIEVNSLSHIHMASSHKSLMTWSLALDVVSFESSPFLQLKLWQWQSSREDIPSSQKCYGALFTPLGRPLGIIPRLIFVCISFVFCFHLFYNSIFSLVCHSTSFLVLSNGYQINYSETPLPDFF